MGSEMGRVLSSDTWEMGSLDVENSSNQHCRLIHLRRLWVGHSYGMPTVEGFPNESSAEKE